MKSVCVFCGSSSGKGVKHLLAEQKLGETLVKEGLSLVYGGGNVGIMGELANTVLKYNGRVTGVIPENLVKRPCKYPIHNSSNRYVRGDRNT